MSFNLPPPDLQVSFALKLTEARAQILQEALKNTVKSLDIEDLDKQLARCAPKTGLSLLAAHGLRGELVFPDLEKARRKSPSTNRFFRLSDLLDQGSEAYRDFHDRIQALTGIASSL